MCGIVGILGLEPVAPLLVDALKRLEYRGYDSAGVATLEDGQADAAARRGQAAQSRDEAAGAACRHVRHRPHALGNPWRADGSNAHPHAAPGVAIVHNGIIENFASCGAKLRSRRFLCNETDTEVFAHLIDGGLDKGLAPRPP